MSAGTVTTGGVVSPTTTTWNVPEPVFPNASFAVQTTVVEPTGKRSPELWSQFAGTSAPPSDADTENDAVAPEGSGASTVMSAGTVTTGSVVSPMTVTLNVPDAGLPKTSLAEQRTVVVPTGNRAPEPGTQSIGIECPSSEADAEYSTTTPSGDDAFFVMLSGSVRSGEIESPWTCT